MSQWGVPLKTYGFTFLPLVKAMNCDGEHPNPVVIDIFLLNAEIGARSVHEVRNSIRQAYLNKPYSDWVKAVRDGPRLPLKH